jgi:tetratricopeptide (TPR) repeat protein
MAGAGYQMGFSITPLTTENGLDMSGDFHGGPHPAEEDNLYKMALENREGANKMVKEGHMEAAVAKYSELIMQLRALEKEEDVQWTDDGHQSVRELRATTYLNLSLCFLKGQQWTHANNTATRALQGDKEPPDPKENVLAPDKKAKALFRRAQAQSEGFGDYEKAQADLQKALEYTPDDKGVQQELRRIQQALKKNTKEAGKKMAGFLGNAKTVQSGEGIFDDKLRPSDAPSEPKLTDIKKLSDGLWLAPHDEATKKAEADQEEEGEDKIDFEELSREINEMRDERPEVFAELKNKVQAHLVEAVKDAPPEETAVEAN